MFLAPQLTNRLVDATKYDKVKTFLLFIGYNRSRHTLLASLLDAHPNVIIANDYNILKEWIENPLLSQRLKYYIYELLYAKSRYDVMFGVRARLVGNKPKKYHYNIKDQWQGSYHDSIQVCVVPARGVARIFQRGEAGGGGHTGSNNIVMAFSPRNIVGCLLKKRLIKGGSREPQLRPWFRPREKSNTVQSQTH